MDYFKQLISDIITEVSYRTKEGVLDFDNPSHINIFSEVLDEMGLSEIKQELIQNIFEAEEKDCIDPSRINVFDDDYKEDLPDEDPSSEKVEESILLEASILDPKYKPGHQVVVKNKVTFAKQLKIGDVVTIVTNKEGEPDYGSGDFEKTLKFPDGIEFKIASNNKGYGSTMFNHLKSGKAMPSGEDWESLIIVAFNEKYEGYEWERAEKFWSDYGEDAKKVADSFRKVIKSKNLSQLGASTAALNSNWGGSNKTPKTDILGDTDERISLKKAGGSQLMSGALEEVLATFDAAMKMVGQNKPKVLDSFLNTLEEKMGRMSQSGTITSLQKLRDSGEQLTKDQEKQIAEMENLQLNAQEINSDMSSVFKDIYFKSCFCFEAATGTTKFADKNAIANELIEFNPGSGTITAHLPMKKIEDAKVLASSNSFYVSFKTGGGGSKPYLALRTKKMSKKQMLGEDIETFRDIVVEEFSKSDYGMNFLNEANEEQLNEFQIFNKLSKGIKNVSSKIKDQAKKILDGILKRIKLAFDSIKRMGLKMFDSIMYFLGIKVESVKISSGGKFPLV